MSTWLALALLAVALGLIVSAAVVIPRPGRSVAGTPAKPGSGEPESELLRRPLRSRYGTR